MLHCATGFCIIPKIVVRTRACRPAIRTPDTGHRTPDGDRPTRVSSIAVPLLNPGCIPADVLRCVPLRGRSRECGNRLGSRAATRARRAR